MSRLRSKGDKVFDIVNIMFFILMWFIMIMPVYMMVVTSFVSAAEFHSTPLILWPKNPTAISYQYIFSTGDIMQALGITVFITVVGTVLSMFFTLCLAYGLSKNNLPGGKFILRMLLLTMFLDTGLIPYYLLVKGMGLTNNVFANIVPALISLWNFLVIRSFFRELPKEIEEAAHVDGATHFQIFWRVVLPISKPVVATFTLFYAVGYWNSWYNSMLFVQDASLHTLQHLLRRMIVNQETLWGMQESFASNVGGRISLFTESVQMAACVIAMVPIICVYPFLQKYFVTGVMIGSIKG